MKKIYFFIIPLICLISSVVLAGTGGHITIGDIHIPAFGPLSFAIMQLTFPLAYLYFRFKK